MKTNSPIQDLLEKPLTRLEFFKYMGSLLLGIFGVSEFMARLQTHPSSLTAHKSGRRFGNGRFGV